MCKLEAYLYLRYAVVSIASLKPLELLMLLSHTITQVRASVWVLNKRFYTLHGFPLSGSVRLR